MKKHNKILITLVIITLILSTFAFANSSKKTIEVLFNTVKLTVNGQKVEADTIAFDGVTYVPLRATAEMLGKEVGWDQETMTASINDKVEKKKEAEPSKPMSNEYIVEDDSGKALYSFRINKVSTMDERNSYSDKKPAQVLLIDFTYKNIANPDELYLSDIYFKVIDSKGKIGYTYPNSKTNYPQKIPVGVTCDAQMIFGIDNASDKITLNFYENMFEGITTSIEIPIE